MGPAEQVSQVAELRTSARGWHGVQLAVLGFIGLCGVLQSQGGAEAPRWLQILSGVLVLVALVLSCWATALVATVAWPISRWHPAGEPAADDSAEVNRGGRRLRVGIAMTFVAVAALATAATSSWWPTKADAAGADLLQVTAQGRVVCGEPRAADPGLVAVVSGGQAFVFRLGDVESVAIVSSCS